MFFCSRCILGSSLRGVLSFKIYSLWWKYIIPLVRNIEISYNSNLQPLFLLFRFKLILWVSRFLTSIFKMKTSGFRFGALLTSLFNFILTFCSFFSIVGLLGSLEIHLTDIGILSTPIISLSFQFIAKAGAKLLFSSFVLYYIFLNSYERAILS